MSKPVKFSGPFIKDFIAVHVWFSIQCISCHDDSRSLQPLFPEDTVAVKSSGLCQGFHGYELLTAADSSVCQKSRLCVSNRPLNNPSSTIAATLAAAKRAALC
jgi:hypothetical protein